MLRVFYPQLFAGTPDEATANELAPKVFEFSQFLVNELGVTDLGARFPHKVTFHDGCHGLREMGVVSQPRTLLSYVKDIELVEMNEAQTCCGFGGAFSVKFGDIATAMGEVKVDSAVATEAEYLVSNDSSCMMHIQGLLDRQKKKMKCIHLAEVLASN
jgi:L-lactate dehydrogenase complex protein LldE